MATYEHTPLMTFKDKSGEKHLLYPITKLDCVDGLEEALAAKPEKKVPAAAGNLAGLNADGGLTDSGKKPGDFAAASHSHAYGDITGKPSSFTPAAHKASHVTGGADAISPGEIGAATADALATHTGNKSNPHGVTAAQAGAVPTSRKVNGKALTGDITLTASDVSAAPAYTYSTTDLTAGTSSLTTGKLYFVYE